MIVYLIISFLFFVYSLVKTPYLTIKEFLLLLLINLFWAPIFIMVVLALVFTDVETMLNS